MITNLPSDCIIEAPGYVDRNGISMPVVGDLPMGCAAVCSASVNVQRLAVEAAVHANIDWLRQAMMMDPLVGAVCNPPEIWQMTDEMLLALAPWMPQWQEEANRAKQRLASSSRIPTRKGYKGAARKSVATIEELARNKTEARKMAAESDRGMAKLHKDKPRRTFKAEL